MLWKCRTGTEWVKRPFFSVKPIGLGKICIIALEISVVPLTIAFCRRRWSQSTWFWMAEMHPFLLSSLQMAAARWCVYENQWWRRWISITYFAVAPSFAETAARCADFSSSVWKKNENTNVESSKRQLFDFLKLGIWKLYNQNKRETHQYISVSKSIIHSLNMHWFQRAA